MAAQTKDISRRRMGPALLKGRAGLAANTVSYKGAAISVVSGTNGAVNVLGATGHTVLGVITAMPYGNGAASGQAAHDIPVEYEEGIFEFEILAGDAVTLADVGNQVFAEDNNTVRRTSNTNTRSVMGILMHVENGRAQVLVGNGLKA